MLVDKRSPGPHALAADARHFVLCPTLCMAHSVAGTGYTVTVTGPVMRNGSANEIESLVVYNFQPSGNVTASGASVVAVARPTVVVASPEKRPPPPTSEPFTLGLPSQPAATSAPRAAASAPDSTPLGWDPESGLQPSSGPAEPRPSRASAEATATVAPTTRFNPGDFAL